MKYNKTNSTVRETANNYMLNMTSVSVVVPLIMLRYRIKIRVYDHPYSSIDEHKERDGNKNYR